MRFPIKRISLNAVCFFSNGILLIKGGIFSGGCQQDMSTPNKIRNIVWGKETPTNGDVPVRKTNVRTVNQRFLWAMFNSFLYVLTDICLTGSFEKCWDNSEVTRVRSGSPTPQWCLTCR